jgi:hypothetical protein
LRRLAMNVRRCTLCGYSSGNLNKYIAHLRSSVHTRGMSRLWDMTRRCYAFEWLRGELSYQRRVWPEAMLQSLLEKQQPLMSELSCTRWGCVQRVEQLWSRLASWFRASMIKEHLRRIRVFDLPEILEMKYLKFIPECNRSYEKLFVNGVMNFQMLNSNMGHRRQMTQSMSSDATDLVSLRGELEGIWRRPCESGPICV